MNEEILLTEADLKRLEPIHQALSARTGGQPEIDLNSVFTRWQRFIENLESGISLDSSEYLNDLSNRELINEIAATVPEDLRTRIEGAVAPWDDRYRTLTAPVARSISGNPRDREWWWFRCPRSWTWFKQYGAEG